MLCDLKRPANLGSATINILNIIFEPGETERMRVTLEAERERN